MKKSNKKNEIVQTAVALIAEKGFHGAPIATIAKKSKVAAGTIYRYFENKDALINDLYNELEKECMAALQKGYSANKPFRERFIHLGTTLLRYLTTHPIHFRYIEQYHNSPYGVSLRIDCMLGNADENHIFAELFTEGIAQQILKDVPLTVLFSVSIGPLLTLARHHILGFIILDDTQIKQTVEACWDGIKK